MDNESKNIDIELKDDSGQVEAVFSIFNSLDSDGDVVVPGAVKSGFKNNQVPMVWSHKWDMPIGKGTITQDDLGGDPALQKLLPSHSGTFRCVLARRVRLDVLIRRCYPLPT